MNRQDRGRLRGGERFPRRVEAPRVGLSRRFHSTGNRGQKAIRCCPPRFEVSPEVTTLTLTRNSLDCSVVYMKSGSSIDGVLAQGDSSGEAASGCMHELIDILRDYRPNIFRFLLASFGDPELAKALTERCVEAAFLKWSEGEVESLSKKSLMRIAVNLERQQWLKQHLLCFWRKTEAKTTGLALLADWLPNDQLTISDRIGTREQIKRAWVAVCRLSNRQKIVFLLHCVEEMTSNEIAEVADLHEWTVHTLLAEALSKVRATIHDIASSR